MLIYLLIAAELAILYTVFWYVYVRDPKPSRVVGNLWGKYGDEVVTTGGIDPTLPIAVNRESDLMQWWQAKDNSESYPDDVAYVSYVPVEIAGSRHCPGRLRRRFAFNDNRRSADNGTDARSAGRFVGRVLGMFTRTLDSLNVKVP